MSNIFVEREKEIRDRIKQFVEEELNPISLQVELEERIPEEIVDKMRAMKLFGLAIPEEYGGLGLSTVESDFRNCRVPKENIIGGMRMVGQGFKTAMRVLDKGRLTMGACALGASQKLLDMCVAHVKRKAKHWKSRDDLQATQFVLADMATEIYAARQMLYNSARARDQGNNVTHEASMVKLFCTEMADRIADRAMDIFEDEGCLKKTQIEMYLRDVRLYRIFEGTSEIQRVVHLKSEC